MNTSATVVKPLSKPWKVGGQEAADIELRAPTMDDVLSAEQDASPMHPNSFNVAMACRTMVRAGTFTGPFAPSHFKAMSPARFAKVVEAMREAEALGED